MYRYRDYIESGRVQTLVDLACCILLSTAILIWPSYQMKATINEPKELYSIGRKTSQTKEKYSNGDYYCNLPATPECFYRPANEASREVTNLTERKIPHTPVYGVKFRT